MAAVADGLGRASTRLLALSSRLSERGDRVRVGELLDGLGRAALGLALMVPALLALIPLPGPFGIVLGVILALIALQVMAGQTRLRLPRYLRDRSLPAAPVASAIRRFTGPLRWAESFLRPRRWLPLTGRPARTILGGPLLLMALTLALPVPLGNALPALALAVFALGFIERDGLAIVIALCLSLVALAWMAILLVFSAEMLLWVIELGGSFDQEG